VFKIVNELKDKQNKAPVDAIWKHYMTLPDKETVRKGKEPMISNKQQLIEILEDLERDNLVMYASDEGTVIMI
jgi:hypothetical protein